MKNEINSIQNKLKAIKKKLEQQSFPLTKEQNDFQNHTYKTNNRIKSKNKNKIRKKSSKKYLSIDESLTHKPKKKSYSSQKKNYSYMSNFYLNSSLRKQKS